MRFLVRLGLGLLLAASLPLAIGFGLTAYAGLAARVAQPNFGLYGGRVELLLTPARYQALRWGLAAVAAAAGVGLALLGRRGGGPCASSGGLRAGWRPGWGWPWRRPGSTTPAGIR